MKSEEVKEFALVIVQSLAKDDLPTGDLLFEGIIKYKKFKEESLSAEIHHVSGKVALFEFLEALNLRIKNDQLFPILHLETHGYEDGIQLASGERVPWLELLPYFRKINVTLGNQLIIVLAVCVGISLIGAVWPDDRAPFNAMIGATRDVSQIDIRNGFESFYDTYFFTFDILASLESINAAIGQEKPLFYVLTANHIFDAFVDPDRDPKHFAQMVTQHAVEEKSANPRYQKIPFPIVRLIAERRIKRILKDAADRKDYFMMTDLKGDG